MCGRFVRKSTWKELRHDMTLTSPTLDLQPSYNVAPTQSVMVARELDGRREGVVMRWGFIPSWSADKKWQPINARAETVATMQMFRSAFKRRRCLILADGYYEWKKLDAGKQPYYYRLKSDEPFLFAGIWETWRGDGEPTDTCAILTTKANSLATEVHNRMPAVLMGADALAWIDPAIEDVNALTSLLRPFDADAMIAYPVSTAVGNVRNNSTDCINPIPTQSNLF